MKIEVRQVDDVAVADLSGRLVLGDAQETLRDALDEILESGTEKIIFNVSGLARLDSSGIGELVACLKTAHATQAQLVLLQIDDNVRRILHVSQVLPLFDVYETEQEAIAALRLDANENGSGEV